MPDTTGPDEPSRSAPRAPSLLPGRGWDRRARPAGLPSSGGDRSPAELPPTPDPDEPGGVSARELLAELRLLNANHEAQFRRLTARADALNADVLRLLTQFNALEDRLDKPCPHCVHDARRSTP